MAKFCEGGVPFTAVTNVAASSAGMNDAWTQIAAMAQGLSVVAPLEAGHYDYREVWEYVSTSPPYWRWNTGTTYGLVLPLGTLRAGQRITACSVVLRGALTGGTITGYCNAVTAAGPANGTFATWAADPWNSAGAWVERSAAAGLPHTVVAGYHYFLNIIYPGGAPGGDVLGAKYTAQFGN